MREAVAGYRSEGLPAEIFRARYGLLSADVQLTTAIAPIDIPPEQISALCLGVREAVTNVVRQAQAANCRIELAQVATKVVLTIEDDGIGGPMREGNGLRGMCERLQAVGGEVSILRNEERGRRVTFLLPSVQAEYTCLEPAAKDRHNA